MNEYESSHLPYKNCQDTECVTNPYPLFVKSVGGLILFFISFKRFNQWDFYPTQIGFAIAEYFHNENLTLSQPLKAGRRHSTVQ